MTSFWHCGGATTAVLTLDTAVDKSGENVADRVARPPARLCSGDRTLCYYCGLEYDFLAVFLVSLFRLVRSFSLFFLLPVLAAFCDSLA